MPKPLIKNQYPGSAALGDVVAKARVSAAGAFIFNEGNEFQSVNHDGTGFYEFKFFAGNRAKCQFAVSLGPGTDINLFDGSWLTYSAWYSDYSYIVIFLRWNFDSHDWDPADPACFDIIQFKQYEDGG